MHVAVDPLGATAATLVYDIGWWGGNFYSIVCDSVVTPTWHPPDPADFNALATELRRVNEHVLFATPDDARAFARWYEARRWAESGPFVAVRLEAVSM